MALIKGMAKASDTRALLPAITAPVLVVAAAQNALVDKVLQEENEHLEGDNLVCNLLVDELGDEGGCRDARRLQRARCVRENIASDVSVAVADYDPCRRETEYMQFVPCHSS